MRKGLLALAGAAALLAPQAARADISFSNCSTSVSVCAGSQVALVNGNQIVMKVWNTGSNNTISRLSSIGLYNLGVGGTFSSASFHDATGTVTDISSYWLNGPINGFTSGAGTHSLDIATQVNHNGDGISNCAGPVSSGANTRWVTCPGGPTSTNGYVTFTFTLNGTMASLPTNLQWAFRAQSIGPNGASDKCFSSGDADCGAGPPPPTTTTPEPVSLTLMATGLAGMSGAGFVRRRRKKQD